MNKRDLVFVGTGLLLAFIGVLALLYGSLTLSLTVGFLMMTLLLVLLVLQRRQLASVQERTLRMLRDRKHVFSKLENIERLSGTSRQTDSTDISSKKVIGLLSAQQISMELLNNKLEDVARMVEREK